MLGSAYGVYAYNSTEAGTEPSAPNDDVVLEPSSEKAEEELVSFDEEAIVQECHQYAQEEGVEGDQLEVFLESCIIQLVDEYQQANQDLEESANLAHPEDLTNAEIELDAPVELDEPMEEEVLDQEPLKEELPLDQEEPKEEAKD